VAEDPASDVAALVEVARVLELLHESVETVACFGGAKVVVGRGGREAEAWDRWRDYVKGWDGRVWWVCQEVDDLCDF